MTVTIADVGDIPGRPPLTDQEKQAIADERNAAIAGRALVAWEVEMRRLDELVLNDSRYWEEFAQGSVSEFAQARMNNLIAEREAHRLARPQ